MGSAGITTYPTAARAWLHERFPGGVPFDGQLALAHEALSGGAAEFGPVVTAGQSAQQQAGRREEGANGVRQGTALGKDQGR